MIQINIFMHHGESYVSRSTHYYEKILWNGVWGIWRVDD